MKFIFKLLLFPSICIAGFTLIIVSMLMFTKNPIEEYVEFIDKLFNE